MKVFVTGGAGFIGSWVTKVLLNEGHEVTVFDNLSTGHREAVDSRAHFIEGSLNDQSAITQALAGHDAIIHMAGFIEVADSVKDPVSFAENNIVNTVRLLEAMRAAGVKKMIFSSSATVYGAPKHLPIVETDPLGMATNPYGATKVSDEFFCQVYHSLYNFDVIILRYFNPYGPGELHNPETHAIPNFVKAALADQPLPVYWQGELVRDFIYIEDLARAHTAVLPLSGYQVFNVGTERGVKVNDVIATLSELLGRKLPIADLGDRPGDAQATYASSKKLQETCGWQATTDLKTGLAKTIEFFQNR